MENKREKVVTHELTDYERGYLTGQKEMYDFVEKKLPEIVGDAIDARFAVIQEHDSRLSVHKLWLTILSLFMAAGILKDFLYDFKDLIYNIFNK